MNGQNLLTHQKDSDFVPSLDIQSGAHLCFFSVLVKMCARTVDDLFEGLTN